MLRRCFQDLITNDDLNNCWKVVKWWLKCELKTGFFTALFKEDAKLENESRETRVSFEF